MSPFDLRQIDGPMNRFTICFGEADLPMLGWIVGVVVRVVLSAGRFHYMGIASLEGLSRGKDELHLSIREFRRDSVEMTVGYRVRQAAYRYLSMAEFCLTPHPGYRGMHGLSLIPFQTTAKQVALNFDRLPIFELFCRDIFSLFTFDFFLFHFSLLPFQRKFDPYISKWMGSNVYLPS